MNKKPLYLCRPLLNAGEFISWAKGQGFKTTLQPEDMHVTLAFSRAPVDWDKLGEQPDQVTVKPSDARTVQPLGPDGAITVRFDSAELEARWIDLINKHGASTEYPDLRLHVSITYNPGDVDLGTVEPYTGPLVFGPERAEEIDPTQKHKYVEKNGTSQMTKGNFIQLPDSVEFNLNTLAKGIFIPITKVDAEKRLVYGVLNEETPDKTGEIMDYETAKPAFELWSETQKKASGGKSLGNLRSMHGSVAAGKFTELNYDDENKRIEGVAKVVDDAEWQKVLEGVYTGFSIGGGYAKRWADPRDPAGTMRYTPTLAETSLVDNPCHGNATFQYVKADGSVEMRKFQQAQVKIEDLKQQHNKDADYHKAKAHEHRMIAEKQAELGHPENAEPHDAAEKAHLQAGEAAISGIDYEETRRLAEKASKDAYRVYKALFIDPELKKGSEDQPRDDHGRFSSGSGSGKSDKEKSADHQEKLKSLSAKGDFSKAGQKEFAAHVGARDAYSRASGASKAGNEDHAAAYRDAGDKYASGDIKGGDAAMDRADRLAGRPHGMAVSTAYATRSTKLFNPISEDNTMFKNTGGAQGTVTQTEEYLALIKAAEDAVTAGTATPEQRDLLQKHQALTVKDGKAVKPKTAVVQFNKWQASDGSFYDSKREAETHELTLEIAKSAPGSTVLEEALLKAKAASTKRDAEDEEHEDDSEEAKKMKAERHEKKLKEKEEAEKKKTHKSEDTEKTHKSEEGEEGQQARNPDVKNNDTKDPTDQGTEYAKNKSKKSSEPDKVHKAAASQDGQQARNPDVRNNEGAAPGYHQEPTNKKGGHGEEHEDGEEGEHMSADGKSKSAKNKKSSETGFSDDRASEEGDPDHDAAGEANGEASSNPANSYVNKRAGEAEKAGKKSDKPYGNVEYADPGHQEDGKKRYPIDTEEHIRAAWNYINKEKNSGQYSAEDLKSVKNKIIAAWKKKIDKEGPPSAEKNEKAWRANKVQVLAKGLGWVACFAHHLERANEMVEQFELEQVREGDDTALTDRFEAWIKEGGQLLVAVVGEEVAEMINDEDDEYGILMPETVMAMSAGLPAGAHGSLAKAVEVLAPFDAAELKKGYAQTVMTKIKSLAAELVKAGARHSKKDMETLGKLHKTAHELHESLGKLMDEHCEKVTSMCKDMGFEPAEEAAEEGEKSGKNAQKMSKVLDQLQNALIQNEAQAKVIETMSQTMTKAAGTVESLTSTISTLNSRIDHLERQPAPARGNVRAVSKLADSGAGTGQPSMRQAEEALSKLSAEDRSLVLMKAALADPKSSTDIMRTR